MPVADEPTETDKDTRVQQVSRRFCNDAGAYYSNLQRLCTLPKLTLADWWKFVVAAYSQLVRRRSEALAPFEYQSTAELRAPAPYCKPEHCKDCWTLRCRQACARHIRQRRTSSSPSAVLVSTPVSDTKLATCSSLEDMALD